MLVPWPCTAWDAPPHQKITKAALDTLPKSFVDRLGTEAALLVELYSIYPDRYEEMARFGFVRRSPGPRSAAEIRQYCVRPDGQEVHGATGDRGRDAESLVFLFERIVTNLSANRPADAAKFAGVLSHFVADSLSPPHSVAPDELSDLAEGINVHSIIERSVPEISLAGRKPQTAGIHLVPAAQAILDRLYSGAAQNRTDLPIIVRAACTRDEPTLDFYRLRAAKQASEIFADALYTLVRTQRRSPEEKGLGVGIWGLGL